YRHNNKVKGYINQDEKAKRDTTINVNEDDIDWIRDKAASKTCHLYHNKFTKENKPTLDCIDGSIRHTKQNCQLACQICNIVKADKDNDISKQKIQLMKYAIHEHLPITINNESILGSAFEGEGQNNANEVIEEVQYMVSESPRQFKCNKPPQQAVFTLDNSKF
ncbi:MAG: hypothetical protein EZS28_038277, partial [Streblomastix strix]